MDVEDQEERELQLLLPKPSNKPALEIPKSSEMKTVIIPSDSPPLDLNLSISVSPVQSTTGEEVKSSIRNIQILKQHTTEQIRLAAVEKAYAERVRELTRREMELAEKEFARARMVWERAREEVEKAERMKELATKKVGATCMEITCQACRQRFRP
ncbi:ZNF706/At2g23090 domain-containing protein [Dioscorea alata]|uniref:ZNF706/At2g23090 domain-containing protein n=1 Tax=Dioscorea alata TaxID=55571 RepID=A0ACB7W6C4_DIOAL|nr:ZNF706/At2g23090 domain-containing protein [Dioscorea alata]